VTKTTHKDPIGRLPCLISLFLGSSGTEDHEKGRNDSCPSKYLLLNVAALFCSGNSCKQHKLQAENWEIKLATKYSKPLGFTSPFNKMFGQFNDSHIQSHK
jgi:hypothetical protein